jgi:hypothetical protein
MKHVSTLTSVKKLQPAPAESMLVKRTEIAAMGEAVAVIGDAVDLVFSLADRLKGESDSE